MPPSSHRSLPAARGRAAASTLVIENHYKDNYWQYPEFAQQMDVFCELVARIDSPHFGVNYDPSNTILAGEDPLELLAAGQAPRGNDARQRSLSGRRHDRRPSPRGNVASAMPSDCGTA